MDDKLAHGWPLVEDFSTLKAQADCWPIGEDFENVLYQESFEPQSGWPSSRFTYFVDPINGDDTDTGLNWDHAFLTAQEAVIQYISDKHDYCAAHGLDESRGINGVIFLGAGDHLPPNATSPIIEIPGWSANGADTGGADGLMIFGVNENGRVLLEGGATNNQSLIHIAGARGIRIMNLYFHRGLRTGNTADILLTDCDNTVNKPPGLATRHSDYFEIFGCHFLGDLSADAESSPYAIWCQSGNHGNIEYNQFNDRVTNPDEAAGVYLSTRNADPARVRITYNIFAGQDDFDIIEEPGTVVLGLNIYSNYFKRYGRGPGGTAITTTTAISFDNGQAAEYRPIITRNMFMGWTSLDATGAGDAIRDVMGAANMDAGTDYYGNDNENLLSS